MERNTNSILRVKERETAGERNRRKERLRELRSA